MKQAGHFLIVVFLFQHDTQGVNCEECKDYFYRPQGRNHSDANSCQGRKTMRRLFIDDVFLIQLFMFYFRTFLYLFTCLFFVVVFVV